MGVTEEEATNLYYAEESLVEVTLATDKLLEALRATPTNANKRLSERLGAASDRHHEAFEELTDAIHVTELALEAAADEKGCPRCGS